MERQREIGILGRRRGNPMWEDDPMQRRDVRCRRIGQEVLLSLIGKSNSGRDGQEEEGWSSNFSQ